MTENRRLSSDRLSEALDGAYVCFTRHGFRRTTMDDIAAR
jgi:AcrR family transcriptional regulator